jgi:hypothetical protein
MTRPVPPVRRGKSRPAHPQPWRVGALALWECGTGDMEYLTGVVSLRLDASDLHPFGPLLVFGCNIMPPRTTRRLFPTIRSTTWSRPMVALTFVLRDRWVRTRALYSASYCHRKADGSAWRVRRRKSHVKVRSISRQRSETDNPRCQATWGLCRARDRHLQSQDQGADAARGHRQISRGVGETKFLSAPARR